MDSYIRVGNKNYKLENGVLVEYKTNIPKERSVITDITVCIIAYALLGKEFAVFNAVSSVVDRIIKLVV